MIMYDNVWCYNLVACLLLRGAAVCVLRALCGCCQRLCCCCCMIMYEYVNLYMFECIYACIYMYLHEQMQVIIQVWYVGRWECTVFHTVRHTFHRRRLPQKQTQESTTKLRWTLRDRLRLRFPWIPMGKVVQNLGENTKIPQVNSFSLGKTEASLTKKRPQWPLEEGE